ncbi:MAG: pilin [Patescibacteria group bacterium]
MIKKISIIYFSILSFILSFSAKAAEVYGPPSPSGFQGAPNPLKAGTFTELIASISDFLLNIGGALATLMILYGGFLYVTSAGEPAKVEAAHKTLTYAIVGLVVVIIGKGFIYVIQDIIGVPKQ